MTSRRLLFTLALCAFTAHADEGMWTFNKFPAQQVQARYGFTPTQAWLDHVRLASVRIAGGCSASIVSPQGLVMTNHHCARDCVESLSGLRKKDFNAAGFFAKKEADEARCPGMEIDQLTAIADVTTRVREATQGQPPERFADLRRASVAAIEAACTTSDAVRCEVVSLYKGGRYDLYTYRRMQDIRIVFAPEDQAANFGGDPDNFNFPRYDLDVSFLRIYGADGKPLATPDALTWSDGKLAEGALTFVAGNPGGTSRGWTMAQIDIERDVSLPDQLARAAELRGFLTEYQHRGPEQQRHSNETLFGVENWLKSVRGRHEALADKAFYGLLVQREADFRDRVQANPQWQAAYGPVWDRIATLSRASLPTRKAFGAVSTLQSSELFKIAQGLLRYGDEIGKPNGDRLKELSDSRLPEFKQELLAQRPIAAEFEIAQLTFALTKMREQLGADHPLVQRVFGRHSAADIASAAVKGSRLGDLRVDAQGNATGGLRKTLFDGGTAAIRASKDPMLELARAVDADARALRKTLEIDFGGPIQQQQELLSQARFAVYGDTTYPDATFTPRLSFGTAKGYVDNGTPVPWFTTLGGAFKRDTGADPFALPKSWLAAKPRLALQTPFNFVTDNDIIGGNSGSPVINQQGEVVGLVFDGNIQSLGGDYGFDAAVNRTVAVHSAALLEALDKIYGARRLVDEIKR